MSRVSWKADEKMIPVIHTFGNLAFVDLLQCKVYIDLAANLIADKLIKWRLWRATCCNDPDLS